MRGDILVDFECFGMRIILVKIDDSAMIPFISIGIYISSIA